LNVATTPATGAWGKFLAYLAKKAPQLALRFGAKLAAMGAMATVPVAGWISALITAGFALMDAYAIYQIWKEYSNLPSDDDKSPSIVEDVSGGYDALGNSTGVTPTPISTPVVSSTASTQAGTMNNYKSRAGTRNNSPTPSGGTGGSVDSSKTTFADLTEEQQNAFFAAQRKQEGYRPGSLSYDLNNPGNMLYAPWQKKYGGELDTTGRGVGTVKGKFAKFPTLEAGVEAQRALWMSPAYASLPLDKALNKWVTGNPNSDMDVNMQAKNTNYKNAIYAAIGSPQTTTLASAPSTPSFTGSTASSGSSLTMAQASLSEQQYRFMGSGGTTVVNAPTNNSVMGGSNGSGGNSVSPYNGDLMRYLLRPVA
jgi:hypothetical protein